MDQKDSLMGETTCFAYGRLGCKGIFTVSQHYQEWPTSTIRYDKKSKNPNSTPKSIWVWSLILREWVMVLHVVKSGVEILLESGKGMRTGNVINMGSPRNGWSECATIVLPLISTQACKKRPKGRFRKIMFYLFWGAASLAVLRAYSWICA